jgi:hypothetical protein
MIWTRDPGFDFALFGRDQRLVAVVEAKSKKNTSAAWAVQLRRNMLAHGHASLRSDYFFIVTPDWLYVWQGAADEPTVRQPSFAVDARPLFAPYFERAGVSPDGASPQAFELVVAAWLGDLVRAAEPREKLAVEQPWLVDSGFLDAVTGGHIEYAAAA